MLKIPRAVRDLARVFHEHGFSCYLVGGAVRDMLMARRTQDFDVATDADPQQVTSIFRRVIPTGIKHGTVTVLFGKTRFEVTTFRLDGDYRDGRRPSNVTFTPSIEADLSRRDFTMNAVACDLSDYRIIDPQGGRKDISGHTIRAIGSAAQRFREDGLRLMRACRFSAQLGFEVEATTRTAMSDTADAIEAISSERIRDELSKTLAAPRPSVGFELMRESGLLSRVLPELEEGIGVEQPALHCFDVYHHCLHTCDAAPAENLTVRLAALLHDAGKPRAMEIQPNGSRAFHRHEARSAEIAESVTRRLKYPNRVIEDVRHLVLNHMFNYTEEWTDAAVRRFVARVGEEYLPDLLALRRSDQIGTCGRRDVSPSLSALQDRIEGVFAHAKVLRIKDLPVDGNDVMGELGLPPGPIVGIVLAELLDAVIADPDMNEREQLLGMARRFYDERIGR